MKNEFAPSLGSLPGDRELVLYNDALGAVYPTIRRREADKLVDVVWRTTYSGFERRFITRNDFDKLKQRAITIAKLDALLDN
jgi:hypothetical protein